MYKKAIAIALSCSLLMSSTVMAAGMTMKDVQLAQAQTGVGMKDGEKGFTYEQGFLDGERQADASGESKFGTGLVVGLLTNFAGTGIGYFVIGPQSLDGRAMTKQADKSTDYQLGFKTAWDKKTQSRKRGSFLAGGLLSTAVILVVMLGADDNPR